MQVVETCWSQKLYDAMIYVYNRGFNDYTTPLLELLLQLRAAMKKGKALPGLYVWCYGTVMHVCEKFVIFEFLIRYVN